MADVKISGLPASTTPLAGTEVLPIVQGTTTKQVSVANLTAGRAISASSITNAALTSDRVTYAGASGLLQDDADFTFNGTTVTMANDASINGLTVGKGAGNVATNTVFGLSAFGSNSTGARNLAVGQQALRVNTANNNTALGYQAGFSNTSAGNNTFLGYQTLYSNTTGGNNTAVGHQAGYANTTGEGNVFLGFAAASGVLTTGSYNIYCGSFSTPSAADVTGELVIATGGGTGKGSNTGFITPGGGGVFQGNNSLSWSVTSDQRLKKNIVDNTDGLSKITAIQVRNFEYRLPEEVAELEPTYAININGVQLGVIAQELQQVLPDCVKTESTGVMSVDTSNLTFYLINAIKELNAKFDAYVASHP